MGGFSQPQWSQTQWSGTGTNTSTGSSNGLILDLQMLLNEDPGGQNLAQGPVFWPILQLYDALNQSLIDTYGLIRYAFTTATMTINPGDELIQWPVAQIMIPQYIIYNGVKIFPTTHAMLQDWSTNWFNSTPAQPKWVVQWDAQHFRLFPASNASYTFSLAGVPWPTIIGTGTEDIPGLDPLLRRVIVLRAAAYLFEATQPELADALTGEALEYERRYWRQVRNQLGDNVTRLRPGTGWSIANFGDVKIGRQWTPVGNPYN